MYLKRLFVGTDHYEQLFSIEYIHVVRVSLSPLQKISLILYIIISIMVRLIFSQFLPSFREDFPIPSKRKEAFFPNNTPPYNLYTQVNFASHDVLLGFQFTAYTLYSLQGTLNPILYSMLARQWRKNLKKAVVSVFRKKRDDVDGDGAEVSLTIQHRHIRHHTL